MKTARHFTLSPTRIMAGLSLIVVVVVILVNLPALASKTTVLLGIGYSDTDYNQRKADLLGAEMPALKFAAENTPQNVTAAWVSDDYSARDVYVRYWLYPRKLWLGDDLRQATGQNPAVILVLKRCLAYCTPAETAQPPTLNGYKLLNTFVVREEFVSVLTRTT